MTQNEKDLLLKDLCARLYTCNCINGTAIIVALTDEQPLESNQWLISNYDCYKDKFIVSNIVYASDVERLVDIDNIKPYFFPLSSMTEEQREEYHKLLYDPEYGIHIDYFDWCHKNHFDCRGLIPMGLANDATGLNIY